jgi:hypothetical protein
VGVATVVIVTVLVSILPASGRSARSARGSDPLSPLCRAYRSSLGPHTTSSPSATRATTDLQKGDWAGGKKHLLIATDDPSKAEGPLRASLSSAPGKERSAVAVIDSYVAKLTEVIRRSRSLEQFDSSLASLEKTSNVMSAEKALAAYDAKVCGSSGSS